MRGQRVIHVRAPLAGVFKRNSFQEQPPWSAYDALNVLPVDFKTGVSRDRIAVRPGFAAVSAGGSGSINMQATLHIAPGETYLRQPMHGRGGSLYRWNGSSFTLVGGSAVDTGRPVCALSYLQKLYILNATLAYKVYTFSGHSVGSWTGSPPADCTIGCVWDDRIVLSGDVANPHVVNFSRQGDPEDWVEDVDVAAPIISTSIEGGNISEPVTALIAHHRQCLLVGHWSGWDVYRGNPRRGGTLSKIPAPAGPVCWTAWCYTSDGWLYFLSRDGLYRMPPGCGDVPQSVSRERLPEELLAVDGISDLAYLEYDVRFRLLYIIVTGSSPASYVFDLEKEGFWPISLVDEDVESIHRHEQFETEDASGVYIGASGFRRLDRTEELEDDAEAFCQIGPIKLSDNLDEGATIYEANAHFGKNTTDESGTISISTGYDAEEAISQPDDTTSSETFETVLANNNRILPHLSGHAVFIDVELGDENEHFSLERIDLHTRQYGKDR